MIMATVGSCRAAWNKKPGDDRREHRAAAADADGEARARRAHVRRERLRENRVHADDRARS